jgi:hypothetical protein
MAVTINGDGTIIGVSVGGLPDGVVDSGTLATNSVDSAELINGAIDDSHLATGIDAGKLINALPAISGASLTGISTGLNCSSHDGQYSSDGAGTITVSSLGFAPKYVSCIVLDNTSRNKFSIGFASYRASTITASQYVLYDDTATSGVDWSAFQGYIGSLCWGGGIFSRLAVTTWGSDSIVFTKTNNTTNQSALAFKINILG